jgi:hypothetical protein
MHTFELAFHLRVWTFRASKRVLLDPRRDKHGVTLRQSIDISYLNTKPSDQAEYLCEAVTSCVVAGTDNHRWTATMLVDTYFDGSDPIRETIRKYHKDRIAAYGMNADPLSWGQLDADTPEWDPRQYFFYVLKTRLYVAKLEWFRTVDHVKSRLEQFKRVSMKTNF